MAAAPADALLFTPATLVGYTRDIFVAAGAPDAVAQRLGDSLVLSNRSGHDSHGVIRIPQYLRAIRQGQFDPKATPVVRRSGPAWAHVDGCWSFGHEAARFAMTEAIDRARADGVGFVSAFRTNHIGRLGEWAEQAAEARVIGACAVAFTHRDALLVAPHQGAGRALSTNPMAIGLPRWGAPPVVLDFATSIMPEGKVRVAMEKGATLPPGSLLDPEGRPTIDPHDLYAGGVLLPFALHKGYALSFMIDALSVALSGADEPDARGPGGFESGAFFLAVDPQTFGPFDRWNQALERLAQRVRSVPPAPGFAEVLIPGEPESRARAARAVAIAIPSATWGTIAEAGRSVGIEPPIAA